MRNTHDRKNKALRISETLKRTWLWLQQALCVFERQRKCIGAGWGVLDAPTEYSVSLGTTLAMRQELACLPRVSQAAGPLHMLLPRSILLATPCLSWPCRANPSAFYSSQPRYHSPRNSSLYLSSCPLPQAPWCTYSLSHFLTEHIKIQHLPVCLSVFS